MKRLLARENRELLTQLAWSRVLLGFDFDGTLAPIVDDRDRAAMRGSTARLFARACQLYPCAIISGRSRADVAARVGGAGVKYVIGNHGLEPGVDLDELEGEVVRARSLIEAALAGCRGVDIEDKRYSLALHYRRSRQKRQALALVRKAVSSSPVRLRMVPGKLVVNVVPAWAANKGDAVTTLRTLEGASTALYVGDDFTDEDVFELDQPGRLFTVRVGRAKASAAQYFLRDQREIDGLLAKLVDLRADGAGR